MRLYPRYRERTYKRHFTPDKVAFLQANCEVLTDRKISFRLGIPVDIVNGYRIDVLKILKQRHRRPDLTFRHSKELANQELEALNAYHYDGIMRESVQARIAYLKNIIG